MTVFCRPTWASLGAPARAQFLTLSRRAALTAGQVLALIALLGLTLVSRGVQAQPARAGTPAGDLRLINYNVWAVPNISPRRVERVVAIAEMIAARNPDIVTLQEVWLTEDSDRLGAILRRAGLVHQHHFGPAEQHPKGSGLWIGSRFPIHELRFQRFEAGQRVFIPWHVDWMADKGFGVATLATPQGLLKVVTTHLQADYAMHDYEVIRLPQMLQLSAALNDKATPLLLTGDLNAPPGSDAFAALEGLANLEAVHSKFDLDAILVRDGKRQQLVYSDVTIHPSDPVALASGTSLPLSDHPWFSATLRLQTCTHCAADPGAGVQRQATAERIRQSLRARLDRDEWRKPLWLLIALVLPLLTWWTARRRQRRPAGKLAWGLFGVGALVGLALAGWSAYAALSWLPYEQALLRAELSKLSADVAP